MGLGTTVKLAVVVTGAIAAGSLLLAGTAVGRKHAAKKHYTSSGHGTYESTGQACFGAKWAGTGGWKTSYKETTTVTNVGTTTDTANGHSSYSWDVSEVEAACVCPGTAEGPRRQADRRRHLEQRACSDRLDRQ